MKKRTLLTACALVLAIAGVTVVKANAHFAPAYYINTAFPDTCIGTTQPSGCTTQNTGTFCTFSPNTYYQVAGCTSPFYKIP